MESSFIRSNLPRVKCFARPDDGAKFDTILPGINQLDAASFNRLNDNPDFQADIKAKNFELIRGANDVEVMPDSDATDLSGFKVEEALPLIKETENTALLRQWRASGESRATVVHAIDKKLEQIEKGRPKKDEGEDGNHHS